MSDKKTPTLSSRIIDLIHDDNGASDVVSELKEVIQLSLTRGEKERLIRRIQRFDIAR